MLTAKITNEVNDSKRIEARAFKDEAPIWCTTCAEPHAVLHVRESWARGWKVQAHFRHQNEGEAREIPYENESELHRSGKYYLKDMFGGELERIIHDPKDSDNVHRADVLDVVNRQWYEFQCSPISSEDIDRREQCASNNGYRLNWVWGYGEGSSFGNENLKASERHVVRRNVSIGGVLTYLDPNSGFTTRRFDDGLRVSSSFSHDLFSLIDALQKQAHDLDKKINDSNYWTELEKRTRSSCVSLGTELKSLEERTLKGRAIETIDAELAGKQAAVNRIGAELLVLTERLDEYKMNKIRELDDREHKLSDLERLREKYSFWEFIERNYPDAYSTVLRIVKAKK